MLELCARPPRYRFATLEPEVNSRPGKLPGCQAALGSCFEFAARNTSRRSFTAPSLMYSF